MNSIEEALDQLGVTEASISAEQRRALDEQGYLVLPSVIEPELLDQLRAAFERAAAQGRQFNETGGRKETGARHPTIRSTAIRSSPLFAPSLRCSSAIH